MDFLIKCSWGQTEERQSDRYFYQNSGRPGRRLVVVQRTLRGEGFLEWQGREFRVGPGKAMLFIHGEESSYGCRATPEDPYRLAFVSFDGAPAIDILHSIRERLGPVVPLVRGTESDRLFNECLECINTRQFKDIYHESSLAYAFWMALSRDTLMVPIERDSIAFAQDFMAARFRLPITIGDVADAAGLSREHFTRNYQARYGISPGKHLQALRLEAACQLLLSTNAPIAVVAGHCGYRDPDSFSRAFRRQIGCNPAAYREAAHRK